MKLSTIELVLLACSEKPGLWWIYYRPFMTCSNLATKVLFTMFPVMNLVYNYYDQFGGSYVSDIFIIYYTCFHIMHHMIFWKSIYNLLYPLPTSVTWKTFHNIFFGIGSYLFIVMIGIISRQATLFILIINMVDRILIGISKLIKYILTFCTSPTSHIGLRIRNNLNIPESFINRAFTLITFKYIIPLTIQQFQPMFQQNMMAQPQAQAQQKNTTPPEDIKHIAPAIECPPEIIERLEPDIEDAFIGPIHRNIMFRPVITPRGITYEFDSIKDWIELHGTDPDKPSIKLNVKDLVTNFALKKLLENKISLLKN